MSAARDIDALYSAVSPAYQLEKSGIKIDGGVPLDFKRYEYLMSIIDSRAPRITIIKGAQMGFTIACILLALVLAKRGGIRGIGYWFPTSGEAQIFSKARFTPLMDQNPHVWDPRGMDVDSAELKRIGQVAIYLRGAGQRGGATGKSTSAVKSIPLDVNILDESDEMDPVRVDAIKHRLDASENPREVMLSTPTLPGYGVDLDYAASNQMAWLRKCRRCNEWNCFEDTYPDCIAEPTNEPAFYVCSKCREEFIPIFGEWVARKPEVTDHEGYWISQLCAPSKTAADIVKASREAIESGRHREFQNQTLARAYAEVDEEITRQQLEALLTDDPRPLEHEGPCAMGVDPGKPHWYEVRVRVTERDTVQVARGQASSYEELSRISKRYNVESGVMDQGYDPSAVAKFCQDHPGWFGCLYVGGKKGDADWDHKSRMVKVGRTRLLDTARNDIIEKNVSFYRKDEFWDQQFVPQMTNLKRATNENGTTGDRQGVWIVTGGKKNDHLRHANAYCRLAVERCGLAASVRRMVNHRRNRDRPSRKRSAMTA